MTTENLGAHFLRAPDDTGATSGVNDRQARIGACTLALSSSMVEGARLYIVRIAHRDAPPSVAYRGYSGPLAARVYQGGILIAQVAKACDTLTWAASQANDDHPHLAKLVARMIDESLAGISTTDGGSK